MRLYPHFILTMGRSPGFGSANRNYVALFRLGFPSAPRLKRLTSLRSTTRRLINQKARGHGVNPAPTICKHTVSGSISLPSPGFFSPFPHGTCPLSVIGIYLALEGGPPRFPQDNTCPVVLRIPIRYTPTFAYGTITLYGGAFQPSSTDQCESYSLGPTTPDAPLNAHNCRTHSMERRVWANPRSLAATWGVSIDFFSSGY